MTGATKRTIKPARERTTPHNVEVTDKERQALELRKAGATLDQIAKQLGYADPSGVHRAITRALEKIPVQAVADYRAIQNERLERLLLAVWQISLAGDLKAVDRALRILDQQARLLGLNVPAKSEVDVTVTERSSTDVALDELVAEMERRAAAQLGEDSPVSGP
jgi:DNA-binding CsgD family transcriptional regulator